MSAEDAKPQPDPKIAALRAAGHDEAADLLDDLAWHDARAAAEKAAKEPTKRPGLPLLDIGPAELQRQHEGRIVLGELERYRGDRAFHGSVPFFDRNDGGK